MAYALHILRPAEDPIDTRVDQRNAATAEDVAAILRGSGPAPWRPIPLEEWRAAVTATPGVRLYTAEFHTLTNPTTNQVLLRYKVKDGDTEVFFPTEGQWHPAIRWFKGVASFNARLEPGDASHPVWAAAVSLAARLNAVIQGDEGEIYDLQTGKASRPNMHARTSGKLGE
jgi:hypothetical protein